MKLLLDTHIILWALDDNPKLTNQTRNLFMDAKNDIYYSYDKELAEVRNEKYGYHD